MASSAMASSGTVYLDASHPIARLRITTPQGCALLSVVYGDVAIPDTFVYFAPELSGSNALVGMGSCEMP